MKILLIDRAKTTGLTIEGILNYELLTNDTELNVLLVGILFPFYYT